MNRSAAAEQMIVFGLAGQQYGLAVGDVAEVVRMVAVEPLAQTPAWLAGVVNLRGQVLPVVDLRQRLDLPAAAISLTTPIVITRDHGSGRIGLIVDLVDDMVDLAEEDIDIADAQGDLAALARVADRLVMLINLPRLLQDVQTVMRGA